MRIRLSIHQAFIVSACLPLLLFPCSCEEKGNHKEDARPDPFSVSSVKPLSTEEIEIGGQTFTLELAFTQEARNRGLMFRKELAANRGMIFIFDQSIQSPFHMKNCLIDLDILFLHQNGTIVHITTMKAPPPGEPSELYYSRDFFRYAIELSAGTAERLQLKVGDKVKLPRRIRNILPDPK